MNPRILMLRLPVLLSLGALAGCTKESPPPAENVPAAPAPAAPAPTPAPEARPATPGAAPAPVVGPGVIQGEVVLTGEPPSPLPLRGTSDCPHVPSQDEPVMVQGGKLQNVLVRLTDAPEGPAPGTPVVVDQHDCMYRPRVQGAVVGQTVQIRNGDGTLHNVHSFLGSKTLFNSAQPPGGAPIQKTFGDGEVVKLKCDVHPWMTGYVVVSKNPFFAVTGPDGTFELKGLPAGSYTLEAWHERFGTKTARVSVGAGAPAKVTVTYAADDHG